MAITRTFLILAFGFVASMPCSSCYDDEAGHGDDAGIPSKIEDLPIAQTISLSQLSSPVDVIVDNRGIPHIYAADIHDALVVQGFLMAKDRMAQMEFMRRAIEGRLAEVAGNLDTSMVDIDRSSRLLGFHRIARKTYEALDPQDPEKKVLDAFTSGINSYLEEIRAGNASLPGDLLPGLLRTSLLTDWTGVDPEALARYQTYSLSFSAWSDVDRSAARHGANEAFPPDSQDPDLAARSGIFRDLWPLSPAEQAYTSEGWFALGTKGGKSPHGHPKQWAPRIDLLKAATPMLHRMKALRDMLAGGGSNNWIVSGQLTKSSNAILANDPHLSLSSPPIWWMNHINTKRAGGQWDVMGVSFAGIPGITLGFNEHVAWGATVNNYDVSDVYQETIIPGPNGQPDMVLQNGQQVPIEVIHETIKVSGAPDVEMDIEIAPNHGPIIPESRTSDAALSIKWTGFNPSNELKTFLGFNQAHSVQDVESAMENFEVGGQNIVAADDQGNIYWSSRCLVPVRDPRALQYDPQTDSGIHPGLVLPATGEYEWIGRLDDEDIPHQLNPDAAWLSTANQDPVGTNKDGNPFNDEHFLSSDFNLGHREARIQSLLGDLAQRGQITIDDMSTIQSDHRSAMGAKLAPAIVEAIHKAMEERDTHGTHPDLESVVSQASIHHLDMLEIMGDRLAGWSTYLAESAVEGDPGEEEIANSIAATLFNATLTRLAHFTLDDEISRIGVRPGSSAAARTLQFAVNEPQRLATYDQDLNDTVLWDDLDTEEKETRDEIMVKAALSALRWLEDHFATADMKQWRWGELHTVRFEDLLGLNAFGQDIFSIPPRDDPNYPNGFPRHGDNFSVDACSYGIWNETSYSYSHGPSQRLVVELTPDGPIAINAIPGGNQHDPALPHHADEAEYWRKNTAPPLAFKEKDVVSNAETRLRFEP